jgi:integrase
VNKQDIVKSNKISRWLNSVSKGSNIRYGYFAKEYFSFVNENPESYLIDNYEFLEMKEKAKISNKYKKDLQDFKNKLVNEPNKHGTDNKPTSIATALRSIKSLFTYQSIDFPIHFWKSLINFSNDRVSITETPTPEQLRKILDQTDIQGKCLFLIEGTSGSRIDSVLQLRRKDIDMQHDCPRVTFYYKHAKGNRTTIKRISPETKHFLESYLPTIHNFPETKLFRMTRQNADYKWKCALKKAGLYTLDENTKRCTMTTHCLKRFFKTQFSKANFGNNEQWADYFCEHLSDLDRRYKDYSEEYKDEIYSKGVQYLLVYEKAYDTDLRVKNLQKEVDEAKGTIKILNVKNESIENSLNELEEWKKQLGENIKLYFDSNGPYRKIMEETAIKIVEEQRNKKLSPEEIKKGEILLDKIDNMPKKDYLEIIKTNKSNIGIKKAIESY